eukprot:scaffold167_cov110-Cylindrotheca_fusiformis.AAC.22
MNEIMHLQKETVGGSSYDDARIIYRRTALGIACASRQIDTEVVKLFIQEQITTSPSDVSCSQERPGHTPLRDAILNPNCSPEILVMLLLGDRSCVRNSGFAAYQRDSNGLFPIDHLVMKVQSDYRTRSVELLQAFIETKPVSTGRPHDYTSPLIRLLTVGKSSDMKLVRLFDRSASKLICTEKARMSRILEVSKFLVENDPSLLYECSRVTGCSPIHVALRNYGDYLPLIKEIALRDASNRLMILPNSHGDLPIHVASSVGVSLDSLRFVIHRTAAAIRHLKGSEIRGLMLTKNNFGYTPIDLEWLNYVEPGSGLLSARSYCSFQSTEGIRFFQHDDYYKLLRETVDEVRCIRSDRATLSEERVHEARRVFGSLIDRITLIISSASSISFPRDPEGSLLHDACKLCSPHAPSLLPLPLLQLILWIHHDEVLRQDEKGNIPLHYALGNSVFQSKRSSSIEDFEEWKAFCLDLLRSAPRSSMVADQNSRLPLHLVLHCPGDWLLESRSSREHLIQRLVESFPESVAISDPVSRLDPFMLSAIQGANLSLDTVFFLLRQSPLLCCPRPSA